MEHLLKKGILPLIARLPITSMDTAPADEVVRDRMLSIQYFARWHDRIGESDRPMVRGLAAPSINLNGLRGRKANIRCSRYPVWASGFCYESGSD
jgi:hypothetical protein